MKWIVVKAIEVGWDKLNAVKKREWRQCGMCIVYECSDVEWVVSLGEMCVFEYCIVSFSDCFVHPVVCNSVSSTVGSNCVRVK